MSSSWKGWTRVRFGDVVRLVRDRVEPETSGLSRYIAGEHMDTDDLCIRRWGNIGDGYLGPAFHMRFAPGHVLYGSRRTYLRKVAVADFEGICANTTFVLESIDPTVLLPGLLPFIMQTEEFHSHSIQQSKGSVNPYVNFSDLAWYEFDLPPMEEQERITQIASASSQLKTAGKRLTQATETLHKSLRQECFSTFGRRLPIEEASRPLGTVVDFLDNIRVPLSTAERSTRKGEYPYYGASGIIDYVDGYLFDGEYLLISEDGANLLSRSTPIAFLATGQFWVNNHAHVIRAREPWTNYLLAEYLESIAIDSHVSGTAQPKLTRASCESIRVPLLDAETARIHEQRLRKVSMAVEAVRRRYVNTLPQAHFLAAARP